MKLERLEQLDLISTKNMIVNEVINDLGKKYFYNKFEVKINLALVLFSVLGNTTMHEEMSKEDIDWIQFVNDNIYLLDELENNKSYKEIEEEINRGLEYKVKYNGSFISGMEEISSLLSEEGLRKIMEVIKNTQDKKDGE